MENRNYITVEENNRLVNYKEEMTNQEQIENLKGRIFHWESKIEKLDQVDMELSWEADEKENELKSLRRQEDDLRIDMEEEIGRMLIETNGAFTENVQSESDGYGKDLEELEGEKSQVEKAIKIIGAKRIKLWTVYNQANRYLDSLYEDLDALENPTESVTGDIQMYDTMFYFNN